MEKKTYTNLLQTLKRLASMYIDNIKFVSAEKISLLMSAVALISLVAVLSLLALIFITIGIAQLLDSVVPPFCSYMIIGGLFILIVIALIIFKKQLIEDPITRFISKLFLDSPNQVEPDENNK